MATATETTTTTDQFTGAHQESGALVHNANQNQEVVQANPRQSVVSHQPRPQSTAGYSLPEEEEARPGERKTQQFLPWYTRWGYNISLGAAQGFLKPASFIRDTQDAIRSPLHNPNLVKHYECRKTLPVR